MLLDSNIIIYSIQPQNINLRTWISTNIIQVSALSKVEVLGYHKLSSEERILFEEFFAAVIILPITATIIENAIQLRQQKRMSLGDSIIAATAIVNQLPIATHNVKDFEWISQINVIDPLTL